MQINESVWETIYVYDYVYLHVSFVDHNHFLPFKSPLDQTLLASESGKGGLITTFYSSLPNVGLGLAHTVISD